jgi:hypothetical protein
MNVGFWTVSARVVGAQQRDNDVVIGARGGDPECGGRVAGQVVGLFTVADQQVEFEVFDGVLQEVGDEQAGLERGDQGVVEVPSKSRFTSLRLMITRSGASSRASSSTAGLACSRWLRARSPRYRLAE